MITEKSSGTVVFHKGKDKVEYLLLHYQAGHWDFPKGHIEMEEGEKEAALRELKEEAGIDGNIVEGFNEKVRYFFRRQKELVSKEVVFFVVETKNTQVTLSYEHIGFKWLPYDEAVKQLTFKNAKDLLKKTRVFLNKGSLKDFV